jgi:hypothetical protein
MANRNRVIKDLCGNEYYVEEARDMQGEYLEVSEIIIVDGQKMKTYLCDIGCSFNDPDDELLDDIDDIKSKLVSD